MIYDERIYTLKPGKTQEYLEIYAAHGLKLQTSIVGDMVGYFYTEFGPLNQLVHIWRYESLEDRSAKRKELLSRSQWHDYAQRVRPLIQSQENKLLLPAPFSPNP